MNVQVCDFKDKNFEAQFIKSLRETGFAVLTNHGVGLDLIRDATMSWRMFFLNSQEYKNSYINLENTNLGYKGLRQETAVGAKVPDIKEFYHYTPGTRLPQDVWASTIYLFSILEYTGQKLLSALDKDDPKKGYLDSCFNSDRTLFRALYYPALDFSKEPDAVRAAAHEDINMLTLLVAASAPGLEVLDLQGNWHAVPFETDSIVVNAGDMLQLLSEGRYKSTTHRVVNPENSHQDRISMPLFIAPHKETILAPGITAEKYLNERLDQIYGKKK